MGCGKTNEKYENRMYFTPNNNYMLANRNNNINKYAPLPNNYNQVNAPLPNNYNQVNAPLPNNYNQVNAPLPNNYNQVNAPLPNNYNQVNENKIFQNFIYCPSCGHPLGNNFESSGTYTKTFNCFECGQYKNDKNYYKCRICNGIFCQNCPQYNNTFLNRCPLCGQSAGNNFKASGTDTETFKCFNCGQYQNNRIYYKCMICNGIFCQNCPKHNGISVKCPLCGESAGYNFKASGTDTETFNCFICGQYQNYTNYYKCRTCNGIFCQKCPQSVCSYFAKCPLCFESVGNNFKASGTDTDTFNCFKCGEYQSYKNYYKCMNCNGIFCQKCSL